MSEDIQYILSVRTYQRESNGEAIVKCPHCKRWTGLTEPFKGEQFQHNCGGWFDVERDARNVSRY